MRLLQLFHTSRRPLNLLGHQCLRVIDNSYSHPCLTSESRSPFRTVICHYQPPPRALQLSTSTYIFSYSLTFWFHDTSMGHAHLVCTHILFFLPRERFGSHSFPSPSEWIALAVPLFTLHYNGTLNKRNIDVFRLYVCS
jgi:hypothetical protein